MNIVGENVGIIVGTAVGSSVQIGKSHVHSQNALSVVVLTILRALLLTLAKIALLAARRTKNFMYIILSRSISILNMATNYILPTSIVIS